MTLKANGYKIICDKCTRIQELGDDSEHKAQKSAYQMGWNVNTPGIGHGDYCPDCTAQLQAANKLGPRIPPE